MWGPIPEQAPERIGGEAGHIDILSLERHQRRLPRHVRRRDDRENRRPRSSIHGRLEELHVAGDAAVQRLPESLRAIPNPLPVLSGPRLKKNLSYSFNLTSVYLVPHG